MPRIFLPKSFLARQAVIITAIFALSLIWLAVSPSVVSAQAVPSPGTGHNGKDFPCQENWSCSEWGNCSLGLSSRLCTDVNGCGTEINKPAENQSCMSLTGIVKFTIIRPPEICGDGKCSKNETCGSCPADCGGCSVLSGFTGLMTGAVELSISGLVVIIAMAVLLAALVFTARKRKVE